MSSLFEPGSVFGTLRDDSAEFQWVVAAESPRLARRDDRIESGPFVAVVLLAFGLLIGRLLVLQVSEGSNHRLLAEGNRIRNQEIQPPRGLVLDRHGQVLVKNVAAFELELVPTSLPNSRTERETVYQRAAGLSNQSADSIRDRVNRQGLRSLEPILLLDHLNHEQSLGLQLKLGDTPGLRVVNRPVREYADAPGLSHLLGYTGQVSDEELKTSDRYTLSSIVGKSGIEQAYESLLQGTRGVQQIEIDSKGYLQRIVGSRAPATGDTLVLSLDLELQRHVGDALKKALDAVHSDAGAAVVLDPRSGEIRAMVSLPDYQSNAFAKGISSNDLKSLTDDPRHVLTNRAVAGQYPSGSVIKPFIASGGLADGVITESTTIDAPAEIKVGNFVFPDWRRQGIEDVKKAIAVSSNVFFYAVGGGWDKIRGLGADRLDHYLELFGFGRETGVDLPGEASGLVPTPDWKKQVKKEPWYLGDTYHLAIGQGDFLVTPLQLANATATVANGGTIETPHFLWKDQPPDGHGGIAPPSPKEKSIIDDRYLRVVRDGMRQGVTDGSSRQLQSVPIPMAGKTGTAQYGTDNKTHAWWTGFGPVDHPELVMTVLIEGGGEGNEVALPVAQDVFTWYYSQPSEARE